MELQFHCAERQCDPEMKLLTQFVLFATVGLLTLQLSLVVPAQDMPSRAVEPGNPPNPAVSRATSKVAAGSVEPTIVRSTQGKANKPGKAGDTGDPTFGGERHPLYRITRSDTVELSFTFSPEFNQILTVQPDGFVVLRGAGLLLAEGLTLAELQQGVTKAYAEFLHDPEITVTLKDFEKPFFLASGEVARPGKYELRGDLTVNEAVAIAGGFTQQALHSQVVLFRRVSSETAEAHVINVKHMLNSRDLREDRHLQPGDLVYVPQSRISKVRKYVPTTAMNWYLNPLQF
jgi:polysaccharide biosynthesis/export protein